MNARNPGILKIPEKVHRFSLIFNENPPKGGDALCQGGRSASLR